MEIAKKEKKFIGDQVHENDIDVGIYRKTIADLTEQNYQLMIRIKELMEADCCGAGSRAEVRKDIKDKNDIPNL